MPNIFAQFRLVNSFETWKKERFARVTGAQDISRQLWPADGTVQLPSICATWYPPDATRDGFAKDILHLRLLVPIPSMKPFELWATCASMGADVSEPDYPRYWLTAHPSGHATCTCADWLNRGGACKHLRAFRDLITQWVKGGQIVHMFHFPETQADAYSVLEKNKCWYGHYYEHSVTAPASQDTLSPSQPPTLHGPSTHVPLPPPNLPEVSLIPMFDQEAELEESVASIHNTVTLESDLTPGAEIKLADNREAIAIQNQQRLDLFIQNSLPNLYGISNLLRDFHLMTRNTEFSNLITTISQQLSSMTFTSDPPPGASTSIRCEHRTNIPSLMQPRTSPPRTPTKRLALMPPSPETRKGTKHIKSYSTL